MGSKKTTMKKAAFKVVQKAVAPKKEKPKATVQKKAAPVKAAPVKAKAQKISAVVLTDGLHPLTLTLMLAKARMLRLHIHSLRKRLGVVSEGVSPWIKTGVRHLDNAILHIEQFPNIGGFLATTYPDSKCSDTKRLATDFAKSLCDDAIDLLDRTRGATDRNENEKVYDEADLILDTVALDMERFDQPVEEEQPVGVS